MNLIGVAAIGMSAGSLAVLMVYIASSSTARWIERIRHPRCRINDEPDPGATPQP